MDSIGIRRVAMVIGGSMGGMHGLEWTLFGQEYVQSAIVLASSAQQKAWPISWNEMQRLAIRTDQRFLGGHYDLADPPSNGLALARVAAMLTYRAPDSLQRRFGRRVERRSRKDLDSVKEGVFNKASLQTTPLNGQQDGDDCASLRIDGQDSDLAFA